MSDKPKPTDVGVDADSTQPSASDVEQMALQFSAATAPSQPTRRQIRRARRRARNLAETLGPGTETNVTSGQTLPVAAEAQHPVPAPPQPDIESPEDREARIAQIQKDLVARRRRRAILLFLRLVFFVLLPTAIVGHYYYNVATDMYETKSEFVIQKAESAGGTPGIGGIFSGLGLANATDSIAVQGYLTSASAMERLDREHGFVTHFQQPHIDDIQRLPPDSSRSEALALYKRNIIVGFDLTEGIIRMSVIAADRETSERFSKALVSYAEEVVDELSERARRDNMEGAESSFTAREVDVTNAAARVLTLQEQYSTFSAEAELGIDMNVIQAQELELEQLRSQLAVLLSNARPNRAQVQTLRGKIEFLEKSVAARRDQLTETNQTGQSLAAINSQLQMAQADLSAKIEMRIMALNTLEQARIEANRQVRYLSVNVPPVAPDDATYPRRFENTAVAFFIFLGVYIMISLTVSILREQVSV